MLPLLHAAPVISTPVLAERVEDRLQLGRAPGGQVAGQFPGAAEGDTQPQPPVPEPVLVAPLSVAVVRVGVLRLPRLPDRPGQDLQVFQRHPGRRGFQQDLIGLVTLERWQWVGPGGDVLTPGL